MAPSPQLNKWLVVIPARLASTRLPRKPLADLGGKPMIVRCFENLHSLRTAGAKVVVATDHDDVIDACQRFDVEVIKTSLDHPSGTDRCNEVAATFDYRYDYVLNVQGDEPFAHVPDLVALVTGLENSRRAAMATLVFASNEDEEYHNPNVVKAIRAEDNRALYFTRASAPYHRDNPRHGQPLFWQHIGVYAFRSSALQQFCKWLPSALEQVERLEQLRALEHGLDILLVTAEKRTLGIDTPADLEAARARL